MFTDIRPEMEGWVNNENVIVLMDFSFASDYVRNEALSVHVVGA